MHLIIDTNVFMSALIKDGLTRYLIVNSPFKLLIPEQELIEIKKYQYIISKKSQQSHEDLVILISELLKYIRIIRNKNLLPFRERAKKIMHKIGKKDVPFIAAAIALNCPIWSDDKHFKKQKTIKVFTTKEMLDKIKGEEKIEKQ
jgi:predicted nucleic acid-binding protein